MESTVSKGKGKTKAQVEKETPFVDPNCNPECPGIILDAIKKRDEANVLLFRDIIREELKPIKRFMRMAWQNRVWLFLLTIVTAGVIAILWYHLAYKV